MPSQSLATTVVSVADVHVSAPVIVGGILTPAGLSIGAHQAMTSGTGIVSEPQQILSISVSKKNAKKYFLWKLVGENMSRRPSGSSTTITLNI